MGAFNIAKILNRPIVHVHVSGAFDVLPKGRFEIRPKPIAVTISQPLDTQHLRPCQLRHAVRRIAEEHEGAR